MKKMYSKDYVESFNSGQSPYRLGRLLKYLELSDEFIVADFGCGNGMLLDYIKDMVQSYFGVDFSPHFINVARNRQAIKGISNADFFCESIESFCSRYPEKFDAGFVMDFAEHVYDEDWLDILTAIWCSLKPGKKLYLHTPNAEFFVEKMKKWNFLLRQFKEHVAVRDVQENVRMLESVGFSVSSVLLLPHYNILRCIHILSFIPLIGKYFKARIFIIALK